MTHCKQCHKELEKNELALNKKLLGREICTFFCFSCLAEYLDSTVNDLMKMMETFIKEGCLLFRKN